jgi:hypothetical protein
MIVFAKISDIEINGPDYKGRKVIKVANFYVRTDGGISLYPSNAYCMLFYDNLYTKTIQVGDRYIWDFFYTVKKIRKIKLKKINESR